jgi:integrase
MTFAAHASPIGQDLYQSIVVQKLAGHSDIRTTRLYYLAVEENDLERARQVQEKILRNDQTAPLLTHSAEN